MKQELRYVLADTIAMHLFNTQNQIDLQEKLIEQLVDYIAYGATIKSGVNLFVANCHILALMRGDTFLDTFMDIQSRAEKLAAGKDIEGECNT